MNTTEIAQAHNIPATALNASLAGAGWDFSRLDVANAEHVAFATKIATGHAERLAEIETKRAAREAKAATARTNAMTPAARRNPDLTCFKCDGKGHIRGFGHIANGQCFQCSGSGIIRRRA